MATIIFLRSLRLNWTRVSRARLATAAWQKGNGLKGRGSQLQKLRQEVEDLSESMQEVETWKTRMHSIQSALSTLDAEYHKDVKADVDKEVEAGAAEEVKADVDEEVEADVDKEVEAGVDEEVNWMVEEYDVISANDPFIEDIKIKKGSDTVKGTDIVKVFINGDAMPHKEVVPWLQSMHAENPGLEVYKAVGKHTGMDVAKNKLAESGIPESQITVVQAKTACANAADAVLTVLYGKHAGKLNFVLSDDKKWFGELPCMEIDPDIRTVWLRFSELKTHHELEELCQKIAMIFLEYCKIHVGGYSCWANYKPLYLEKQIRSVLRGRRFRKHLNKKMPKDITHIPTDKDDIEQKILALALHASLHADRERHSHPNR